VRPKPDYRHRHDNRISIHAPAKGATIRRGDTSAPRAISIHAPAKGATIIVRFTYSSLEIFQSTHPRRVRHETPARDDTTPAFQSTHPRRVRRPRTAPEPRAYRISIHAPAKGATRSVAMFITRGIFQSTHPRRVRPAVGVDSLGCLLFQSTHPRRVRRPLTRSQRRSRTYFNPRTREGCDWFPKGEGAACSYFNPRTREGCDREFSTGLRGSRTFQSTHPRRVRPPIPGRGKDALHFNPRTREGCDHLLFFNLRVVREISIHAPAKGATGAMGGSPVTDDKISIHAPAKGAT